jgi:hypothetical protein
MQENAIKDVFVIDVAAVFCVVCSCSVHRVLYFVVLHHQANSATYVYISLNMGHLHYVQFICSDEIC